MPTSVGPGRTSRPVQTTLLILIGTLLTTLLLLEGPLALVENRVKAAAAAAELAAGPDEVYDPNSAVRVALADLRDRVDRYDAPYTRYLATYNVPILEREAFVRELNFQVNSLSWGPVPYLLEAVPGSRRALWRMDFRRFRWKASFWEDLALKSRYFLADALREDKETETTTEVTRTYWPGGEENGTYYPPGTYKVTKQVARKESTKTKETVEAGFHLDPQLVIRLQKLSDSVMPVLLGSDFLAKTCQPPFYHTFLAIGKTEEEFHKQIDADLETTARLSSDRQGTVVFSGVTIKNRRLTRLPTRTRPRGGFLWFSTDAKTDTGKQNYLEILLDRGVDNFDASEQIASLPNGLQIYFLCNNKGVRQDAAPAFIAGDKTSTSNDPQVRNGVSCVRCHTSGILTFKSVFKSMRESIDIDSYDYKKIDRLDQLYGADLEELLEADAQQYEATVLKITGSTALVHAKAYKGWIHRWDEAPVDLDAACADLGAPRELVLQALRRLKNVRTLQALIADEPESISRAQWEAFFATAATQVYNLRVEAALKALKKEEKEAGR